MPYSDLSTTPPLPGATMVPQINANAAAIMAMIPMVRVINDDFAVWQGPTASTAQADDTYTGADGWYALTQTASVNVSQLSLPENGYRLGLRITQNQAAAQRFGLAQVIEAADCQDLRGAKSVLSPRVRISNSQALGYAICEWTSTADVVTSDIVNDWTNGTFTAGNFFLAANLNVLVVGSVTPAANTWTTLADISATHGGSCNNVIIFVWTQATAATGLTLDFDRYLWHQGDASRPSAHTPYALNLIRCQRFAPVLDAALTAAELVGTGFIQNATSTSRIVWSFPVRTARPITGVIVSNPTNFMIENLGVATAVTAIALGGGGSNEIILSVTTAALVAGQGCILRANNVNCRLEGTGARL